MGLFASKLMGMFGLGSIESRILMVGLDFAGKTTILYKLNETVEVGKLKMTIWDVGGQDKIRSLWKQYYNYADAIIYVVDSNDRERAEESAEVLNYMLKSDELSNAVLLIYANKQDLPHAMTTSELVQKLRLNEMRNREWRVQGCCAHSGDGLYEGLDSLSQMLKKKRASSN